MCYKDGQVAERTLIDLNEDAGWSVIDIDYDAKGAVAAYDVYLDGQTLPDALQFTHDDVFYFDLG